MRILSLGCSLPDSQIDNYDWGSAPSFFDYDAMVVDPAAGVSRFIESVVQAGAPNLTYAEEPIEDGATTALNVGLADLLRRRQEETERLLAKRGLVVCFAYPDVPHTRVSGFTGCHRYYWLPAPAGSDYGATYLRLAHGSSVRVTDYEHPFADYLERQNSNVLYRVRFAEGANGFGSGARVIARSPGGAAIGLDLEVGGGRVVFLPALPSRIGMAERSTVASSIVTAIRNALLLSVEESPPSWLDDYPLPGLEAAQQRLEAAESRLEAVEIELNEARNEYRGIDRYRRLLWQEGRYGFDLPVRDALTLLGFTSYARVDEPATFSYEGETVFVETESSPQAAGMEPHYRLRQRLEAEIAREGRRPRGLIVVNGQRELPPAQRPQQYTESLRVAAESMRYCVVEAAQLFAAVRDKLQGSDKAAQLCRRLLETEGILTFAEPAAPVEAAEQ